MFNWEFQVEDFIYWVPCTKSKYKAYLELKKLYPNTKIYFLGKYTWDKDKYKAITKRYTELVKKEELNSKKRLDYKKLHRQYNADITGQYTYEARRVMINTRINYNSWLNKMIGVTKYD